MARQTDSNATTTPPTRLSRSHLCASDSLLSHSVNQQAPPSIANLLRINPIGLSPKRTLQTRFIDISASLALHRKAID